MVILSAIVILSLGNYITMCPQNIIGCFPDRDLNLFECLKHCDVIVTAAKQRDDFFGEEWRQKIVGKNTTLAVSVHVGAGA
jgi:hypothetical protein